MTAGDHIFAAQSARWPTRPPRPTLRERAGRLALLLIWVAAEMLILVERLLAACVPERPRWA